jgi:UDP-3-O-[3-hydroxymyristoyl] glucosamine N-acyltransferase
VHYGRLVIEDDVHVGACVTIDRGHFADSLIGRGTKIDNQCHLAHNVRVGRNCLMAGDFMTAGTVTIGDNNVFGGSSRVSDHVTVGDNMQFAGLAAIVKNINEPGKAFGGRPLQPVNDYLKSNASIAHLPTMRKNVARIMRKLGMS